MKFGTLLLFSLVSWCNILLTYGQQPVSLYYICIGSQHYSVDYEKYKPGFTGLHNLEAASTSANKMAELFDDFGAVHGEVVTSNPQNFITKDLIFSSVDKVISKIKKDKKPNPFLIFYYAGHGFSSPQLEGHFIPPGDFIQNYKLLTLEQWDQYGIAPLDIHERLQKVKLNHMIMLDCCYEGKQEANKLPDEQVVKVLGIEDVNSLMKETYSLLTAMNRMIGPDPVIFSCPVDTSVVTVPMPDDEAEDVGPLCRKAFLIKKKVGEKKLSIKNFTMLMLAKDLDTLTIPAVSHVEFDSKGNNFIKAK